MLLNFSLSDFVATPLLNIIFDILKVHAFRKYSTCWVFFNHFLCLCQNSEMLFDLSVTFPTAHLNAYAANIPKLIWKLKSLVLALSEVSLPEMCYTYYESCASEEYKDLVGC